MTEAYAAGFRTAAETAGVDPVVLEKYAGVLGLVGKTIGAALHPIRTANRVTGAIGDTARNIAMGGAGAAGNWLGSSIARYFQLLTGGNSKTLAPIVKGRLLRRVHRKQLETLRSGKVPGATDWASSAAAREAAAAGDMKALRKIRRANKPVPDVDSINGWSNRHLADIDKARNEWWKARAAQWGTLAGAGGLYAYTRDPDPTPDQDDGALTALRGLFGG